MLIPYLVVDLFFYWFVASLYVLWNLTPIA